MINWLVGILLGVNSWWDYRKYEIWPASLWVFSGVGCLIRFGFEKTDPGSVMGGLAIGGILLLISWVTGGSVGMGDGWILCVTGIYLGGLKNLELLLGAMFLCGIFSVILLAVRRKTYRSRIPFVPFLFVSFLCGVVF